MYANALTIFQHTWRPLLVYGGVLTVFGYANMTATDAVTDHKTFGPDSVGGVLFNAGWSIGSSALIAALMSVCFSRIARRIEGSMWRVPDSRTALSRFFGLWFLLVLTGAVITQTGKAIHATSGDESVGLALWLISLFVTSLIVPLGILVVFHGNAGSAEAKEGLSILEHQFPSLMVIVLGNMMLLFAREIVMFSLPRWALPLSAFLSAARVMFVFSCAWAVCVYHRDEYEIDNDFDM